MKTLKGFFSILTLAAFSFTLMALSADKDWTLRKNEDGIKVYTRPVAGSDLDEFKGTCTINAKPLELANLLKKVEAYPDWLPNCIEAKLIKREGNTQIHYSQTEAPFPVSNRDSYYRYTYTEKGSDIKVRMEALPDYGPEREDVVRMVKVEGYWYFKATADGKTKVTYQVHADPGGSIPSWLTNSAVVDNPYNTLSILINHFK